MRKEVTFAGVSLATYGVYISGSGVFNAPIRAYNEITIPGRNGILLGNEKRLENIEVTYPAFVYSNFAQNMRNLRGFLLSKVGYYELSDTYHTDEYRMACYMGGLEVEPTTKLDAGNFDITFNCKPQRYLNSGKTSTTIAASGSTTISNPTLFDARPLIRAYGTGSFEVNGVTVTISTSLGYTDIDCDTMDCFYSVYNRNQYVSFSSINFPVLSPGSNAVTNGLSGNLVITPRWWTV